MRDLSKVHRLASDFFKWPKSLEEWKQYKLSDEQKEEFKNATAIAMNKGYGTFHHPLMVHGSYANSSEISPRAFVWNVFADGTVSNTNEPLLSGAPAIPKGQKIEGQYFPLLFERNPSIT